MTNLPQGWEVKKLDDIVKLKNGFAFKSNLFCDKGIPIVRIKNIQNENIILDDLVFCNPSDYKNDLNNYLIFKNDILIAMSGATTGKIGIYNLNDKAYLNQRIGLLRIDNNILRKYVFWFLYCNSEQNLANAFGAAQPNLNTEQIHNIQIPLPPLKEQERIVGILDFAFSKIDENIKKAKENLANIDELIQSALQKAFNPLNDNTKENYQLPQTWEWKSLNSVVLKTSNVNPCDFNDDKFYYIGISSIDNKNFCICSIKNINKQYAPSRARKDVLYGDILYATTRPNLKNIAINYYNFNNIVGSTGFCVLRANENLNNKYLFFFLLSDIFDNYISKFIRGAQYPSVSDKDIFNSKSPYHYSKSKSKSQSI
nr:restriction endonuclease subunit S [Campylobacter jejuni]